MIDPAMRGATVEVVAQGVADDPLTPPAASATASGEALRPPAPCHLAAWRKAGGSVQVEWNRRGSWSWSDGDDSAPQRARVTVGGAAGEWRADIDGEALTLATTDLAALGPGPVTVAVEAIGPNGPSRPARVTVA